MYNLLTAVVGFLLTAFIGNKIIHAWQMRTWLLQQKMLGEEKDFSALASVVDEISTLAARRLFEAEQIAAAIREGSGQAITSCRADYRAAVAAWNERLPVFYAKLIVGGNRNLAYVLERKIQKRFYDAHGLIASAILQVEAGRQFNTHNMLVLARCLMTLRAVTSRFNQQMLLFLQARRSDTKIGQKIYFNEFNLQYFSTWQLLKAIFVRDINALSIIRPPLDS